MFVDIIVQWCAEEELELSKEKTETVMLRDSGMGKQLGKLTGTKGFKKKVKAGSVKGSLVVTSKGGIRQPTIRMGNRTIKYSPLVKYLGVKIGTRMTITEHVKEVTSKGKSFFHKLGNLARANKGLSFSCLKTLYEGVFLPIVLYGVGAWGI